MKISIIKWSNTGLHNSHTKMGQIIKTKITPQLNYQVQAFFRAALNMNDTQTVKKLLKHQREALDIEAANQDGVLPIHLCAIGGNKPMMSILLRAGADIDATVAVGHVYTLL